jgi:hypothetical protein
MCKDKAVNVKVINENNKNIKTGRACVKKKKCASQRRTMMTDL